MNRGDAGKLVRSASWLKLSERTLLLVLLERADNRTCEIEAKYAPHSRDELARWAGLSTRQVQRALRHLEHHGWVSVDRGNGRGKRSRYVLCPGAPDPECACPKGDTVTPIREVQKGDTVSEKGRHGVQERETSRAASPQVEPRFEAREARTEEGGVLSAPPDPGCQRCSSLPSRIDHGGNRFCAECAPHIWKEPAA